MVRRTLFALAFAGALSLPSSVSANIGETPLRSFCFSPAMDYCLSIWTWEWSGGRVGDQPGVGRFDATVEAFGHGFETEFITAIFKVRTDGDTFNAFVQAQGPGLYNVGDSSPTNLQNWVPTVYDITSLQIGMGEQFTGICSPLAGAAAPCYELPEPGTWLLLATGLAGVALASRRRRLAQG